MAILETFSKRESSSTTTREKAASARLLGAAKSGFGLPARVACPVIQPSATGNRDRPMTVMMEPVTTGGKKRTICAKKGTTSIAITAAASTAPIASRMPASPRPPTIVSSVETEAKEMPCTSGSCAPRPGTPTVCRSVARPLTSNEQDSRSAIWDEDSPAAPPTMIGTAMTPPNMDRMCCSP